MAHAPGNSFPSGHSLGSIVCYGALFLVFLPAASRRWRTWFAIVTAALVAMIGISRTLLGVHYISDVIGGWAIGIAWLGLTTFAFELTRRAAGRPASHPVAEGLEPEAGTDLQPAQQEPRRGGRGRIAAGLLVAWVLILGAIIGIGELITRAGNGNILGDRAVPRWLDGAPDTGPDPVEPGVHHAGRHHGDPGRDRYHRACFPWHDKALAACRLSGDAHDRRTCHVPHCR